MDGFSSECLLRMRRVSTATLKFLLGLIREGAALPGTYPANDDRPSINISH
jgi:hypothetical protein